jgi:hypothetical protein
LRQLLIYRHLDGLGLFGQQKGFRLIQQDKWLKPLEQHQRQRLLNQHEGLGLFQQYDGIVYRRGRILDHQGGGWGPLLWVECILHLAMS